jgi:predicted metal-dependent phosphoesterase TrpH
VKLDLHLHSWCSDGLLSPEGVLEQAVAAGLEFFSLADHETAGGYLAIRDKTPADMRLVLGIEFSTYDASCCSNSGQCASASSDQKPGGSDSIKPYGREMHILGYFPGGYNDAIASFTAELQQERVNRAKVALVNLRKVGCKLGYDQLLEHVRGDIISRAHMARALLATGQVSSIYEAFSKLLGISKGMVPPPLLTPARAIDFIRSQNGVPVWAHPEIESFDMLVKSFSECGLRGVEICSQKHGETYSFYFERTARVLGLLVTYGSDWHGHNDEKLTGITVPYEGIAEFLDVFSRERSGGG